MRMKVYIIDEAHMLTKEGANAFLKTLEEPPAHALFILATTEPERLPVTILSRCQRYAFRRIAVPVMIEKLREVARGENVAIDDAALAAIAYRAEGGLRDALTMLEQLAAFAGGAVADLATVELAFGSSGREFARELMEAIVMRDATRALAIVETASDAGTDLGVLMRSLVAAFRNLLVARIDPGLLARDLAPEDAERAALQAAAVPQAMLVRALRSFTDALALARTGGNARLELETALLRFIFTPEDPTLDALTTRVAALEERRAPAPSVEPEVPPPAPAPAKRAAAKSAGEPAKRSDPPELSVQRVRAAWQSIRGKVEGERQSLRAPLSRAAIEGIEHNALVLKLPDAWSADALRDHAKTIEAAIADVLGVQLQVRLRVDGNAARTKGSTAEDADVLFDYANERIR
jgi:DNA polymerase-3 subunit gamma/tau